MAKIERFEDLEVWQQAQAWAVEVYQLTKIFPDEERFGLSSQVRRSVASISANIAEGFGRKTPKDKLHFYTIAYGSTLETKNFLYLANKLSYIDEMQLSNLLDRAISVQKLLNAFMRPLRPDYAKF